MSQVIFIKLKNTDPAPPGYTEVRSMRGIKIYEKVINHVTQQEIDDISNLFNTIGVNSSENMAIVPKMYENAFLFSLEQSLEKMSIGGKKYKNTFRKHKLNKSKKTRQHKKSRQHKK